MGPMGRVAFVSRELFEVVVPCRVLKGTTSMQCLIVLLQAPGCPDTYAPKPSALNASRPGLYQPNESMYPSSIYFGLKVVPI